MLIALGHTSYRLVDVVKRDKKRIESCNRRDKPSLEPPFVPEFAVSPDCIKAALCTHQY